jgi:allantoate deiminase
MTFALNAGPAESDFFAAEIVQRLDELAHFSDVPRMLTRRYLGPAHKAAASKVGEWMAKAGMQVRMDALASVIGRYPGRTPDAPTLYLGSHIDTVRNAGHYDGTLGVVAAISVVGDLNRRKVRLPVAIEVVAFGDEEGSRYPSTLSGSRALSGTFDPALMEERDPEGESRADALAAFGCRPDRLAEARLRPDAVAYVELHIEQGPVLEAHGVPVGVVTAINGSSRGMVTLVGVAGHAGTVPMDLRHDALMAAAEMLVAIEARAKAEPDLVATVGKVKLPYGAVNTIPGGIEFSYDIRSPSDARRVAALADIRQAIETIAARRGIMAHVDPSFEAPASPCDPGLSDALAKSVARCGLPVERLPSGAGHDAMAFRGILPIAMLFVRCRAGISHNPAEYASPEDIEAGARVLADFLATFQPSA